MRYTTPFFGVCLTLLMISLAGAKPVTRDQAEPPIVPAGDLTAPPAPLPEKLGLLEVPGIPDDDLQPLAQRRYRLTYQLANGSEKWDAAARRRIVEAMDAAVEFYNSIAEFDKHVTANYSPGTPTADANYNGWINFGGSINKRVALHEIAHTLGVGQHPNWQKNIKDGKWTGRYARAMLLRFDGRDAVLHADRQHFWPYGLNFDKESSKENDRRHVLMVAALRMDMGIRNGR